jgi:hypothetical protein
MQNVADSFGGGASFNTDTGAMSIDASLANYEKLYEAVAKQISLQHEL